MPGEEAWNSGVPSGVDLARVWVWVPRLVADGAKVAVAYAHKLMHSRLEFRPRATQAPLKCHSQCFLRASLPDLGPSPTVGSRRGDPF